MKKNQLKSYIPKRTFYKRQPRYGRQEYSRDLHPRISQNKNENLQPPSLRHLDLNFKSSNSRKRERAFSTN